MSDVQAIKKQMKIKTGSVARLFKEYGLYTKEEEELRIRLDKLKEDKGDDWDIKNTTQLINESERMIKDTQNRLKSAVAELRELVVIAHNNPASYAESEELINAEAQLYEANL